MKNIKNKKLDKTLSIVLIKTNENTKTFLDPGKYIQIYFLSFSNTSSLYQEYYRVST